MAAKTGKLTANGARKKKLLRKDFGDMEVQMGVGDVTSPIADTSTTGTKKGGDRSVSQDLDIRRGREDSLLEADWSPAVLLPVQSIMKGETVKWVVVHEGKGGHKIRVSRGDGSGCVAEEPNDLQEGFFFSRQGIFLVARA